MGKLTSRVPDCWYALFQLLEAQSWPMSTTGQPVPVLFGVAPKPLTEAVVVVGTPATTAAVDVATNHSDEELFSIQTRIVTEIPGRTVADTFERLRDLGDVVQNALRNPATGKLTNAFNGASPQYPVEGVISWRLAQYRSQMYLTTAGFGGYAELDVLFKTRI